MVEMLEELHVGHHVKHKQSSSVLTRIKMVPQLIVKFPSLKIHSCVVVFM
jgi:hypothetical protein